MAPTFCPLTSTVPPVGRSMAAISLSSVDLPAPECPPISISSPLSTSKLTPARRQAAGGIGQPQLDAPRPGGADGVEYPGGGIAGFLRDDRHRIAFAPGHQLFARRGTKGVAGGEQHALALALKMFREFADGG